MRSVLLAAVGVCFLTWHGSKLDWHTPDIDFTPSYSAGKLGPNRFQDPGAMRAENAKVGDVLPARVHVPRPPVFAFLMAPFSALPYQFGLLLWRIFCAGCIIGAVAIWARWSPQLWLAFAWSLPALWTVWQGQDVAFSLLAASGSVAIANPVLAGAVLGFAVFKWHLFLFVPVALIARHEWRIMAGGAAAILAIALVSFALRPDWVARLIATASNPELHPYYEASPGLRLLFVASPVMFVAIMIAAIFGLFWVSKRLALHAAIALALAAGCIINAHSYAVDCILLLPLVALAIPRYAKVLVAWPIPYWGLLLGVPAMLWAGVAVATGNVLLCVRSQAGRGR